VKVYNARSPSPVGEGWEGGSIIKKLTSNKPETGLGVSVIEENQ